MRMWNVNSLWMCDAHLVQEHADLHVMARMLAEGRSLDEHVRRGQVEIHHIRHRHKRLEEEIAVRGLGQMTLLPAFFPERPEGLINVQASRQKLLRSCLDCAQRAQALRHAQDTAYFRATIETLKSEGLLTARAATKAITSPQMVTKHPLPSESGPRYRRPLYGSVSA